MKLSISNIGWNESVDEKVYFLMNSYGFSGLEIAPTRIFPVSPYEKLEEAQLWALSLKQKYGFSIPSMQSIWYGRGERIFGSKEEYHSLLEYTKKAIDFAAAIDCKNIVFGCPRNRSYEENTDISIGISFFKEIGDYAKKRGTVIGMEANPPIYNTNYINTTEEAIELIRQVDSEGFKLNLDVGTMVYNSESINLLKGNIKFISHVHISEPGIKPIQKRKIHKELKEVLLDEGYKGYVSVEMGKTEGIIELEEAMQYVSDTFSYHLVDDRRKEYDL